MFRQTIHDAIRTMKSNASREEVENTLEKAFQQSTPWYKRPNPTWNHKDRDGKTPLVYAVDFCDRPSQIEVLSVILSKRFPDKKSISANQESLDEFVLAVNTAIRKKNILFFQALYDQNLLHSKTLFSALKKADSQFLAALSELAHAKESAALLRSILTEHASHKLTDEQTNKLLGVVLTKLLTEPVSTQEANAAINTIINYKTKSNYHHLLFTMTLLVRFDKLDLAAQHINSFLPSLSAELYSISRTVTPAMPDQTRTQLYFQAISLTLQNEKSTLTQCLKQCDDDTLEKLDDFFKKNTSLDPSAAELYLNAKIKACQKKNGRRTRPGDAPSRSIA